MDSVSSALFCVSMLCSVCVPPGQPAPEGVLRSSSTAVELFMGAWRSAGGVELAVMRGRPWRRSGVSREARCVCMGVWQESWREFALAKRRWWWATWTRGLYGACAKNAAHCKDRRLMRGVVAAVFQGARPCSGRSVTRLRAS
jgi:hypothetical protein